MASFSQTSLPLNCHSQAMDSLQKPLSFSARVPSGSPVPRQLPTRSLNALRASFGVFRCVESAGRVARQARVTRKASPARKAFMKVPQSWIDGDTALVQYKPRRTGKVTATRCDTIMRGRAGETVLTLAESRSE